MVEGGVHVAERIPFNGDVLKWARKRLSYAIEDAARRVNVSPDRLQEWESGDKSPTVKQARNLARLYDRPFLEFFFRDIPNVPETELVPDFRFHRIAPDDKEIVALREIQRWAEEQRLNALDLLSIIGEEAPRFPANLYATTEDDVEGVAQNVRDAIDFSIEHQLSLRARERSQFASIIRSRFERMGVLVLRQSDLKHVQTRGICLFAETLPVIVFGNESPGAQAFTLAHEFGHILLKQSAISGQPRFGSARGRRRIEGWCNRFAAALLMPKPAIRRDMGEANLIRDFISDDDLSSLANRYAVSRHAMLIRLVNLGFVKRSFYWFVKRPQFLEEEDQFESKARSLYYGSRYRSSRGDFYTGLVIEAWNRGQITNHNAAEFMGIKNLSHLNDIRANFGP